MTIRAMFFAVRQAMKSVVDAEQKSKDTDLGKEQPTQLLVEGEPGVSQLEWKWLWQVFHRLQQAAKRA